MHLLTDDVYLDLIFTSFNSGGDFSYERSTPAVIPTGDYNGNGIVDAADYVIWRRTLDQTGLTPGSGADGNSNGMIDAGDYTFWRSQFGSVVSGVGAVATTIPECALSCSLCNL